MIDIIPSILVKTRQEFIKEIDSLEHVVPHVQLDIADGIFVPNTTWGEPEIIRHIDGYTLELHLMVKDPLETIALWNDIPQITRYIIHYESVADAVAAITHAKNTKKEVFIALNPETTLEVLTPIHRLIEGVLFMGVHPGFQGQPLIPEVLEKIAVCRETYPELYTELDGGVQENTLQAIAESGVQAICPGSLVFKRQSPPHEQIMFIKSKLAQHSSQ